MTGAIYATQTMMRFEYLPDDGFSPPHVKRCLCEMTGLVNATVIVAFWGNHLIVSHNAEPLAVSGERIDFVDNPEIAVVVDPVTGEFRLNELAKFVMGLEQLYLSDIEEQNDDEAFQNWKAENNYLFDDWGEDGYWSEDDGN